MIILIDKSDIILDLMMFPYIFRRNFSDFVVVKKTPSICTISCLVVSLCAGSLVIVSIKSTAIVKVIDLVITSSMKR